MIVLTSYDDDYDDDDEYNDHNDHNHHKQKLQLSESTMVLTGGQLHPNLVTEYSGIDSGWQVG